jgi:hypothetical protein
VTAPAVTPANIEHVGDDHVCGTSFHVGERRAHYWVDHHGCEAAYCCNRCVQHMREYFATERVNAPSLRCTKCGRSHSTFAAAYQLRPL